MALRSKDIPQASELHASSRLKLRAKRLLALGDFEERFEASVLLQEAARKELRAAQLLFPQFASEIATSAFGALVEACSLFITARDPVGAAECWATLLQAYEGVQPELAASMKANVGPRFTELQHEYSAAVAKLQLPQAHPHWLGLSDAALKRARREAHGMATRFWGDFTWWVLAARAAELQRDWAAAWEYLNRARRLKPGMDAIEAASTFLAPRALPIDEADGFLTRVRQQLDSRSCHVSLMYALTELGMLPRRQPGEHRAHLQHALGAARLGLSKEPGSRQRSYLLAVESFSNALLDGSGPSVELLYRAGLHDIAVRVQPDDDLTELLTESVRDAA